MRLPVISLRRKPSLGRLLKTRIQRVTFVAVIAVSAAAPPLAVAANALTPNTAHASVLEAICDFESGSSTECINRNGSGHAEGSYSPSPSGTAVIGWDNDHDNNEDFVFQQLTGLCGGGYVTSTCPFTVGSGYNDRFLNDEIVQIKDTTYGLCVGTWANNEYEGGYTNGNLQKCNIPSTGSGGGTGTIFAISSGSQTPFGPDALVSRYWSNWFYANPGDWDGETISGPAVLCGLGSGTAVDTGWPTITLPPTYGGAPMCQWSPQ